MAPIHQILYADDTTYLLTPWGRFLLERLTGFQLQRYYMKMNSTVYTMRKMKSGTTLNTVITLMGIVWDILPVTSSK
jgi:hypothetical protein